MHAVSSQTRKWRCSAFTIQTRDEDGTLILFNSYTTAFARISLKENATVEAALQHGFTGLPTGVLAELSLHGFFVVDELDEAAIAEDLYQEQFRYKKVLQLILLPNENCNFRCKYCSQTFARNRMKRSVIEGIVRHVESRATELEFLSVGWFGGEPLLAPDIIDELSTRLQSICDANRITYAASITTNGYNLRPDVARMLFRGEVRHYQITLDGVQSDHDRLRVLANGQTGTFERILENLKNLRSMQEDFQVVIRVNFDHESQARMDAFLNLLQKDFHSDSRFVFDFHPVGRWGGPNDATLAVCGADEGRFISLHLADKAAKKGFELPSVKTLLEIFGSRCYAANPNSFVIGADGTVYKCTVAFEDPRNQIGLITDDGRLVLDETKHAMWTASGASHVAGCKSCSFRPACHGGACPLYRMDTGESPCPTVKVNIDQTLRIVASDLVRRIEPARAYAQ